MSNTWLIVSSFWCGSLLGLYHQATIHQVMIGVFPICITLVFLFFNETRHTSEVQLRQAVAVHDDVRARALQVLQTKCNVCHLRQNPRKVFTRENMDSFAPKIHRQVFVKKRMPKGKKIKLTAEEYQILSTWITSTKHQ